LLRTALHLKTQSELRDEVEDYLNDSGNTLATAAQYYGALNRALSLWAGRVVFPHLYEFSFGGGDFDYALPSYIRRPFYLLIRQSILGYPQASGDSDNSYTWQPFVSYDLQPNGTGGFDLHLHSYPYAESGRIVWLAENGRFPTTAPTTNGEISSTATSVVLTVTGAPPINDAGYIKINSEWMSYAGVTRTSSTAYTLSNLVRGLYGTVAATQATASAVSWGIGCDDERLWQQLYDRTGSFIHLLNMNKSTNEDKATNEKLYVALKDNADRFWRNEGYVSQRAPRLVLTRGALGAMPWV
jgi:hypothetical protein